MFYYNIQYSLVNSTEGDTSATEGVNDTVVCTFLAAVFVCSSITTSPLVLVISVDRLS